jgi:hypothetical protein
MMLDRSVRCAHVFFVYSLICICYTAAKGKFINDAYLAGFAMWEAGGDSDDILLDAIRSGIGIGC